MALFCKRHIFSEYDSDDYKPYRVTINVKEKSDGNFVYSFSAEAQEGLNTPQTLHAVVNGNNNVTENVQPSDNIIRQNDPKVNTQSQNNSDKKDSARSEAELASSSAARGTTQAESAKSPALGKAIAQERVEESEWADMSKSQEKSAGREIDDKVLQKVTDNGTIESNKSQRSITNGAEQAEEKLSSHGGAESGDFEGQSENRAEKENRSRVQSKVGGTRKEISVDASRRPLGLNYDGSYCCRIIISKELMIWSG